MITINNEKLKVFDMHGHLGYIAAAYVGGPWEDDIIKVLDMSGVDKICLSSFLGITTDYKKGNKLVSKAISKYPDRILGYASINPNYNYQGELDKCFEELRMSGIKIHTDWHDYPLSGKGYQPALEYANYYSLPVLVHGPGDKEKFIDICQKYSKAKFIIPHIFHNWDSRSRRPIFYVIKNYPNVYGDISPQICYAKSIEKLVEFVGENKIVFGSDHPLHDQRYVLGLFIYAGFSIETKKKILFENAADLFDFDL